MGFKGMTYQEQFFSTSNWLHMNRYTLFAVLTFPEYIILMVSRFSMEWKQFTPLLLRNVFVKCRNILKICCPERIIPSVVTIKEWRIPRPLDTLGRKGTCFISLWLHSTFLSSILVIKCSSPLFSICFLKKFAINVVAANNERLLN